MFNFTFMLIKALSRVLLCIFRVQCLNKRKGLVVLGSDASIKHGISYCSPISLINPVLHSGLIREQFIFHFVHSPKFALLAPLKLTFGWLTTGLSMAARRWTLTLWSSRWIVLVEIEESRCAFHSAHCRPLWFYAFWRLSGLVPDISFRQKLLESKTQEEFKEALVIQRYHLTAAKRKTTAVEGEETDPHSQKPLKVCAHRSVCADA